MKTWCSQINNFFKKLIAGVTEGGFYKYQFSLKIERSYFSSRSRLNKGRRKTQLPQPPSKFLEGKPWWEQAGGWPWASHHGAHRVCFRETEWLSSISIMRSKKQSHKLGVSLSKRREVTASKSMSHVCLLVLWEVLRALALFLPNVKIVPRYTKLDLWMKGNNYFPQSMSFMIQSTTLQLTERLVKSTSHLLFMTALFHKHSVS